MFSIKFAYYLPYFTCAIMTWYMKPKKHGKHVSYLSRVWFLRSCLREKFECQARLSGYQGNGLIASISLPSVPWNKFRKGGNKSWYQDLVIAASIYQLIIWLKFMPVYNYVIDLRQKRLHKSFSNCDRISL